VIFHLLNANARITPTKTSLSDWPIKGFSQNTSFIFFQIKLFDACCILLFSPP